MVKSLAHLTLDTDLVELAKARGLNLSETFNNYLKDLLYNPAIMEESKEKASYDMEIASLTNQLNALKMQRTIIEKEKNMAEEEIRKKDYERRKKISDETGVPVEMIK